MGFTESLITEAQTLAQKKPGLKDPVSEILKEKESAVFVQGEKAAEDIFKVVFKDHPLPEKGQLKRSSALHRKFVHTLLNNAYQREQEFARISGKLKKAGVDLKKYDPYFGGDRYVGIMYNPQYRDHYLQGMMQGKTEKEHELGMAVTFFENFLRMFDAYDHPEKYGNLLDPEQTDEQFIENYPKIEAIIGPSTQEDNGIKMVFGLMKKLDPDNPYVKKYEKDIKAMAERSKEIYALQERMGARAKKILNPLYPYFGTSDYTLTEQETETCMMLGAGNDVLEGRDKATPDVMKTCFDLYGIAMNDQIEQIRIQADPEWDALSAKISGDADKVQNAIRRTVRENNQRTIQESEAKGRKRLQVSGFYEDLIRTALEAEGATSTFHNSDYWNRFNDGLKITSELAEAAEQARLLEKKKADPKKEPAGIRLQDMHWKTAKFVKACVEQLDPEHREGIEKRTFTSKELAGFMELSWNTTRSCAKDYQRYKLGDHYVPGRTAEGSRLNSEDRSKLRIVEKFLPGKDRKLTGAAVIEEPVQQMQKDDLIVPHQ